MANLWNPARARAAAAMRTIRRAVRHRTKATLRTPLVLKSAADREVGYIDRILLHKGMHRISGRATVPVISIASEAQSVELRVEIPLENPTGIVGASGFEGVIGGVEFVRITVGNGPPLHIVVPQKRRETCAAWVRTLLFLAAIPLRNTKDILGWFLRGDSEAGARLERMLVPPPPQQSHPIARAGVFSGGSDPPLAGAAPVDILIPVFNAPDDLQACLARVEQFTAPGHRIILVDDASTDPRIAGLLADFARRRAGAELLANPQNLGFVASVNRGLDQCRHDVILLNSDAMVAEGWVERLMAPIHADPSIASVTPMTNNGEIANVPVICRPRSMTGGEADRINAFAGRLNPLVAITDIPTGVGFCMAIARPWLDRVPRFDEAFGRGYGEEVDWCRKVAAMGARHVLTGAVFVEHRGGMSFGEEKARRIAENSRIISHRYPGFDAAVAVFKGLDPAVGPRLALGLAAADRPGGPVPVYLAHRLGGGAGHWLADEIATHLGAGQPVAVLRDGDAPGTALLEVHGPEGVTIGQVPLDEVPLYLAGPDRRRLVYSNLVAARAPLDLLARAVAALQPQDAFEIVFHDFLPLCPSYNLIGSDGRYCGLPDAATCQRCYAALAVTSGQRPATIAEWRATWRGFMDRATGITVFSEDSRAQVARVWPDLAARIAVIPHRCPHLPARVAAPAPGRLTVGVLADIGYSKGAKVLRDLADVMGSDMDIVVIGKIDPAYAHRRITVHGPYGRRDIAALAARYRVGCWLIPSIWPETFCYSVHEALATGLPVFVFDLGAQAAAAAGAENGHLLPTGCEGAELERRLRDQGFPARPDGKRPGTGTVPDRTGRVRPTAEAERHRR